MWALVCPLWLIRSVTDLIQNLPGASGRKLVREPLAQCLRLTERAPCVTPNDAGAVDRADDAVHFDAAAIQPRERSKRHLTVPAKCLNQRAFGREYDSGCLVVHARDRFEDRTIVRPRLHRDDALPRGRYAAVHGNRRCNTSLEIQTAKTRAGQHERIELPIVELAQASIDVSTNGDEDGAPHLRRELRDAPDAAGADRLAPA